MTPFVQTNRVTSPYGYREYWNGGRLVKEIHRGVDVVATSFAGQSVAQGAWTVREVTGGKVLRVAYDAQRGHYVDVQTQPNTYERYQHLARVDVGVGETVQQGAVIGVAGSTGNSTGVHLHFGVYRGGTREENAVNPAVWLGLPNKAGCYAGNSARDDLQSDTGNKKPSTDRPPSKPAASGTAMCHIGPASAGDRAALAKLAQGLLLAYTETVV